MLGGSWLEASSGEQTQGVHTRLLPMETETGTAEVRRHTTPGESALVKLLAA